MKPRASTTRSHSVPPANGPHTERALVRSGQPVCSPRRNSPSSSGPATCRSTKDIATVDSSPGFLNGILSLLLNWTAPSGEYRNQNEKSTAYFHRAAASRLVTLLGSAIPALRVTARPSTPSWFPPMAHTATDQTVIRAGREYPAAFPREPRACPWQCRLPMRWRAASEPPRSLRYTISCCANWQPRPAACPSARSQSPMTHRPAAQLSRYGPRRPGGGIANRATPSERQRTRSQPARALSHTFRCWTNTLASGGAEPPARCAPRVPHGDRSQPERSGPLRASRGVRRTERHGARSGKHLIPRRSRSLPIARCITNSPGGICAGSGGRCPRENQPRRDRSIHRQRARTLLRRDRLFPPGCRVLPAVELCTRTRAFRKTWSSCTTC